MQNELEKGILRYVDSSIENAPYTQIYTGMIKSSGADGYTISLNGVEYTNVPSKGTFLTNDTVRVVVPNNQYSNMFILSDSTGGSGTGAVSSVNGMTGDVVLDKSDIGLGNVPNVTTNNQTPTFTMAGTDSNLVSGETLTVSFGKIAKAINSLIAHIADNIRHITSTERTNWNISYTNSHTHSNKTILDNTTSSYTTTDKTKLNGIESGAQVNDITGVKGDAEATYRIGNVNITKANVGLGNVANVLQYSESNPQINITGSSGSCTGNSATATKATNDGNGNNIYNNYYRKGLPARIRNSSINQNPAYVTLCDNNVTLDYFKSIRAFAGSGNWWYCADKRPEYTITCNVSGYASMFNNYMSDTFMIPTTNLSTTPFVITIKKSSNYSATDVLYFMLTGHRLSYSGKLTDYKIETTTNNTTWTTMYQRTGVSDDINGLTTAVFLGTSGYNSPIAIRITISGATPIQTTNSSGWGYNKIGISSMQLIDIRPFFTAAQGIGALDLSGGTVYGNTTFLNGISGILNGSATKATQDALSQQIDSTYIKSLSVLGSTITYTKGDDTTGTITVITTGGIQWNE